MSIRRSCAEAGRGPRAARDRQAAQARQGHGADVSRQVRGRDERPRARPAPTGGRARTGCWTPDQPPLKPHHLADLFPALADEGLAALTEDIKAHGLREPIWLYQGQILDGRNRFAGCRALEIPCPTRDYEGDDPLGFVVSLNLHRRHLNESQRAMVAAKLANMRQGERTDLPPSENSPKVSQAKAADLLNISDFSLRAARKVRWQAQPEVIKAVEAGTMAVSAGAKLADQPAPVQRAVVQEIKRGAAKTVPAALRQVQGTAPPPTRTEGHWLDPLAQAQGVLRLAVQSFDSFGGMAAAIGRWSPEQRQMFRERVAYIDGVWQQFLRDYQALPEALRLAEEAPHA